MGCVFFDIEVSLKGICIAGNIKNSITIIVDNNRLFALTHASDKNRGPTNNKTCTCHALRWPSKQVPFALHFSSIALLSLQALEVYAYELSK